MSIRGCAPHECVAGEAGVFAEDVPECDVDGSDDLWSELGFAWDLLLGAEVEGFPVAVDLTWIFADEEGFDGVFEVGLKDLSVCLGQAGDAGVGADL